jgi:acetyl esterase/lipase
MGPLGHGGSREMLLGRSPEPNLIDLLSCEKQVTKRTPPCFIWHTKDDPVVPVQNSVMFAEALKAHGVEAELHLYEHGAHGLGLGGDPESDHLLPWTDALRAWLVKHRWARIG